MNDTRRTIRSTIRAHPGIHVNALVRQLGLAPGQVQYHLKRLRSDDEVIDEPLYGRTHYFPPEYDPWERRALALLRRETAGDIVAALLVAGPSRPATIATELDIARSTLEYHLDRLAEHGLVTKQRDDRGGVTLVIDRRERTIALLRTADPTLRDRLIDRFTRLVDRLLEEAQ